MKKVMLCTAAIALLGLGGIAQANITIETVAIGDAGNAGELSGAGVCGGYGPDRICGSVGYNYNIGKYEVTAGQYTAFLNAKANVSDTYGLYNTYMFSDTYGCKIERTSVTGGYSYTVDSVYANRPVNYVSYWDSLRFANWLGNGQGNSSTETGAYTIPDGYNGTDGRLIQRNTGATWAVTSEDEWYKAAYYKNGTYSLFANGTSVAPVAGTDANCNWAIDSTWDGTINGALEQNGTKDMMGNVEEWNESIVYQDVNYAYRGLRGGSFDNIFYLFDENIFCSLHSSTRGNYNRYYENYYIGFRVSEVPEPSSIIALFGGLTGLIGLRRRYV
ncbi:MAG: SUMF1/EgtB/PvdO family nonheme iron enzyme [Armatimonadetes bacterium]|nr:SUMF1/EgtB/PvdO family nonheme iron enzyme [Armatimonadota bacterium]